MAALGLAGCVSTSNVLELGKDTFTVSSTADGFRTAASATENAFERGHQKCAALSKHFMLINTNTAPTRMGIDTTVTVTFRCLNENDPEYTRPVVKQVPAITIENTN